MASKQKIGVLFVCTGNICRSPTAEGIFRELARQQGLDASLVVDSAGLIGYHQGEPPDPRSIRTAARHGIDLSGQRARKLGFSDFHEFDFLLAMDRGHLKQMRGMAPAGTEEKLILFLSFHPSARDMDVPDPYYGGDAGFEKTFHLIREGAEAFLAHLEKKMRR